MPSWRALGEAFVFGNSLLSTPRIHTGFVSRVMPADTAIVRTSITARPYAVPAGIRPILGSDATTALIQNARTSVSGS